MVSKLLRHSSTLNVKPICVGLTDIPPDILNSCKFETRIKYSDTVRSICDLDVLCSPSLFSIASMPFLFAWVADFNASSIVSPAIHCFAILNRNFSMNGDSCSSNFFLYDLPHKLHNSILC